MTRKKARSNIRLQISEARIKKGWSYDRLAYEAGISRSAVVRYLAGQTDTGTEKADAMLNAMR